MPVDRTSPRYRWIAAVLLALATGAPSAAQPPADPPAETEAWVFRGGVYESTGGEEIRPISGVTVGVYGTQRQHPDTGRMLRSARTDPQGEFEIVVPAADGRFAYYHVRQTDREGYASAHASSREGTVRNPNWVEFDAAVPQRIYADIRFWDIGPRPDLLVGVSTPVIEEGGARIEIPVQVWNNGSAPSTPTDLRVASGDWSVALEVPALAAGAAEALTARLAIPPARRGERHIFRAEVDAAGRVEEFNEENNRAEAPPIEIPALPDLFVLGGETAIREEGRTVHVTIEVTNSGDRPAPETSVRVESDGWSGSAELARLEARRAARVEIPLEVPIDRRGRTIAFRVTIDPEGRVEEMDESNNDFLLDAISIPDLPDLRIREARATLASDRRHVEVGGAVVNAGGIEAAATEVTVAAGSWRGAAAIPALGPGASSRFSVRLSIPDARRGGSPTFSVRVDPESRIAERDEGNNAAEAGPVQIPDLPDLVVRDLILELLSDRRTLRIAIDVGNRGGTASTPTTVRVEADGWGGAGDVGRIAPGGSAPVEIQLEIPPERRGREHRFRAHVDPEDRVEERDETNNRFDTDTSEIPDLPDLVAEVRRLRILSDEDSLSIVLSARNDGGAPAASAVLHASSAGWEQRAIVPALGPGQQTEVELRFRIGDPQRGTTQRFRLELDPADEIRELDEGNNRVETPEIEIPERKPVPVLVWIAAGALVLLLLAGLVRWMLARRRRREWQAEARSAEPPTDPHPGERYCRRIELELDPEGRRIAALTVAVRPAGETGSARTIRLEGKGVAALNDAIDALEEAEPPADLRDRLETIAEGILRAAADRAGRGGRPLDLRIDAHLVGGKATCEYVLYRCDSKGSAALWVEEARWTARTDAASEIPVGDLREASPEEDAGRARAALAEALERFLRKV
ncbi:MAG: hypothetical protein GF346_10180 [Candidatus Eisenbacteria bacterium]|nr:hypothetical protein [Candidatus Latescibacterota bacterium]MBD3302802.1 hypothetical protein [Candidatus Eisenbacteria bacterium]